MIRRKGEEFIGGRIPISMKGSLKEVRGMGGDCSGGEMEVDTRVISKMGFNAGSALSTERTTASSIKGTGAMACSMVRASRHSRTDRSTRAVSARTNSTATGSSTRTTPSSTGPGRTTS